MEIISETTQVITCVVQYIPDEIAFEITFVYAYNLQKERLELWNYLRNMKQRNYPLVAWLTFGDFNVVLHQNDRLGGNAVILLKLQIFNNV